MPVPGWYSILEDQMDDRLGFVFVWRVLTVRTDRLMKVERKERSWRSLTV